MDRINSFKARPFPSPLNIYCLLNSELTEALTLHIYGLASAEAFCMPFSELTVQLPTFCCLGTFKFPKVHANSSLLHLERLFIREGILLYLMARVPNPGHPLVLLPDQVDGISRSYPILASVQGDAWKQEIQVSSSSNNRAVC